MRSCSRRIHVVTLVTIALGVLGEELASEV